MGLARAAPEKAVEFYARPRRGQRFPPQKSSRSPLCVSFAGRTYTRPFGLAGGLDRNGVALEKHGALGVGFSEIGTVTPHPQIGNPTPRLFSLREDRACINRLGFPGHGAARVLERLKRAREREALDQPLWVNLGPNTDAADPIEDYVQLTRLFAPWSDALVFNVSSPNLPGLRALQSVGRLEKLLQAIHEQLAEAACPVPALLIKLSPDEPDGVYETIADWALERKLAGLVLTNTTLDRPESLRSPHRSERGGLSGAPLFEKSTAVLRRVYRHTQGRLPLVGVGGIDTPERAWEKICAGATLLQSYTGVVLNGPSFPGRVAAHVAACLEHHGLASVEDAVGRDC